MIHMGSDHRSVMAQFVITAPKKEVSQKIQCDKKKMKTTENTSQSDDKTRSGEAIQFEDRYAELDRKIKHKAEIAATTQKQGMTESLKMSKQAEGVVAAGITALPCWNEFTNATASVMMRSGTPGAVAEAIHHSSECANANAAATDAEHEEVKLFAETQLGEEIQESESMETRMSNEKKSCNEDVKNEIPEFTQDEVQAVIDKLKKKGKASDNNGIRAEDIKTCCTLPTLYKIVLNNHTQQTLHHTSHQTRPSSIRRPGRIYMDALTKRWIIL